MAIADVQKWLDEKGGYDLGRALYERYGKSSVLKNLFKQGEGTYTSEKLRSELFAINQVQSDPVTTHTDDFKKHMATVKQKFDAAGAPEKLIELEIEKGKLYREASFLQSRLELMADDNERSEACAKILSNFDKINQIWIYLDYWIAHKKLHPDFAEEETESAAKPVNVAEVIRTRNNLRSQLSRAKKNPLKADHCAALAREIDRLQVIIDGYAAV